MKQSAAFQNQPVIQITSGPSQIRIAPQFGALLLDWFHQGREIIRWPEDADWKLLTKIRGGNPVLFPFIARHMVAGEIGKWTHPDGRVLSVPMHGFARQSPFAVLPGAAENEIVMRLEDSEATRIGYPYRFRFDVTYRLDSQSLACGFSTTNTGSESLPWQAGHHFYFAVPSSQRTRWKAVIPSRQWGRQSPDGSIRYLPAENATFALSDGAAIDRFQLVQPEMDALLEGPDWKVDFDLNIPGSLPWHTVTTWSESPDSDFYCVEPWLGLPNAIHHGDGIRWLAPGQTETATCVLTLS